jgi:hypothetical protein
MSRVRSNLLPPRPPVKHQFAFGKVRPMHGAPRQPTVPVSWWMGEMVTRTIGWVTVVPNLPRGRLPPVRILAEVHLEYHNRCPRPALLAGEPLVQEEQVRL